MDKKAFNLVLFLVEALILVVLVITAAEALAKLRSSDRVFKTNLANDMVMMADTLVGVSGEAVIEYPKNTSDYIVLLGQDKVRVFKREEGENQGVEKTFILPEGYKTLGSLEEKERLCLEKKEKTIFLRECKPDET